MTTAGAPGRGRPRGGPRLSAADLAFAAAFAVYAAYTLAVLASGLVAAAAGIWPSLHETLHLWELRPTLVGRAAGAMADAAHHTVPLAVVDYAFSAFNLGLAGFLLWLRPRDRTARLLAVAMTGTAAVFNLQAYGVYQELTPTTLDTVAHSVFGVLAATSYVLALLLFPDGRLVPRWSRWRLLALYVPVSVAVVAAVLGIQSTSRTVALIIVFGLLTPAVGVAAQAYRYRRAVGTVERQQSRLLFWALVPALLIGLFVLSRGINASAFSAFEGRSIAIIPVALFRVFQAAFGIIPIALFIGLLRFRLWDIDRVLNRAFVYGALAGFVGLVYVAVVVGVGRLVGSQGDNIVLSIAATGLVAVAFEPVRERVQVVANRLVYGHRATPYEVLSSFSTRMADELATEERLAGMARLLAEGTAARRADVWLVVAGELRHAASWPHDETSPAQAIPLAGEELPPLGPVTGCEPVRHHGEVLGALSVTKPGSETLNPVESKLLADLAAQAGLVLRNVRLTTQLLDRVEELRLSRQRLVAAQDEARRRLERNLHDGAQQQLVALKVRLGLVERLVAKGQPVGELLGQLRADTDDAIDTLRDLARGIYPPLLAAEGLQAALVAQARKAAVPVQVTADGTGRYSQGVEAAVYFCCLEALQNIAKYAGASRASIALEASDGHLIFRVADDGAGFDPAVTAMGAGLANMTDRIDALGGTVSIESVPGGGTTVTGRLPAAAAGDGI